MIGEKISKIRSLLIASHFGPTVIVVTTSFILSVTQFPVANAARIALAIFAGQLVVGWSNDLIDLPLDQAAGRESKPLVAGKITATFLQRCIAAALIAATILSLLSPLGIKGTLVHLLGLLSATLYNIRLKSTVLSPIPYVISFGAMPWAVYLSKSETPPLWLYLGFALFAVAFHFLNVIKDLQWDLNQGVMGLPQRIGRNRSVGVALILIALAALDVLLLR
jgi:4-hydroxybenzoate polyprenyltransferase